MKLLTLTATLLALLGSSLAYGMNDITVHNKMTQPLHFRLTYRDKMRQHAEAKIKLTPGETRNFESPDYLVNEMWFVGFARIAASGTYWILEREGMQNIPYPRVAPILVTVTDSDITIHYLDCGVRLSNMLKVGYCVCLAN